jgi:predicted nucleic acid-binding protein
VTPVVIDASAGAEIVADSRRGHALVRLLPEDAAAWVPDHFYVEAASVIRRQLVIQRAFTEPQASAALRRLRTFAARSVSTRPLLDDAWRYRHNMTAADAVYVVLAEHLGAALLTDDHRLADAPTFPASVPVLRLPIPP